MNVISPKKKVKLSEMKNFAIFVKNWNPTSKVERLKLKKSEWSRSKYSKYISVSGTFILLIETIHTNGMINIHFIKGM